MDLRLELPSGTTIRYQPLFPRGTWLSLGGPATVNIVDSRVSAGDTFQDGRAWVRTREFGACQDQDYTRGFILDVFPERPTITADGGIIAGVTDLNPDEGDFAAEALTPAPVPAAGIHVLIP